MNAPLYQGPQYTPAHATQATVSPQHPFADNFLKSAAAQTQQALDLEAAIRDRQEYTLEQNRSAALQAAHQALDNEMIERLSLDDGAEDSFYDDNGILKKDEIESLRSRYLSVADAWTSGFTTEQGRAAATQAQQQYRSSVTNAINSKILAGLGNRARRALQNNIKACMARGDYDTPIKLARESNKEGYTSNANLAILEDDINTARWENELATASNPEILESVKRQLESSQFFQSSPMGKAISNKMEKKLDAMLEYQGHERRVEEKLIATTATGDETSTSDSGAATASSSSVSKKKTTIIPPQPPDAASGHVKYYYYKHKGNFDSPEAQEDAYAIMRAELGLREKLDADTMFEMKLLADTLGLESSYYNIALENRKKELQGFTTKFSPTAARKTMLDNLNAQFEIDKQQTLYSNDPKDKKAFDTQREKFQNQQLAIINQAFNLADEDYFKWEALNKDANDIQKARAYQSFLMKRKEENKDILNNWNKAWRFLRTIEYFDHYENLATTNAEAVRADRKQQEIYRKELAEMEKRYNNILKYPHMEIFYADSPASHALRVSTAEALAYQSQYVHFNAELDDMAKAVNLPDTTSEYIIYTNPAPEKTAAISRQDAFLVQQGKDTFRVKIVETDAVSAPVPSLLLQKKLKIFGKYPTNMYFQNNILTFTKKPKRKPVQTQNYITPPSDMLYDENGNPSLYPANPDGTPYNPLDDGLAPTV